MCERAIGRQWRILQLNVEGISQAKSEVLSRILLENDVDVAVLQETHAVSDEDLARRGSIPGYNILASVNSRVHGIATYVRNGAASASDVVQITADNSRYSATIRFCNVHVTNVYKSPVENWSPTPLDVFPHPAIYLGDFNSHHQEWSYANNDVNGDSLVEWASKNSLHLIFDAKDQKTFFSRAHQRGYNPDLCFVSCDNEGLPIGMRRSVLPAFPNSQHRPILFHVGLAVPTVNSVPRPRWNFAKAGWDEYRRNLDDTIRFIPPVCENYSRFLGLVVSTAKKSIPRGYRKEYIPCWSEESDRLYEELRQTESPETARELLRSLDDARRSTWSETVSSMSFTGSSRKAWALLRRLGGGVKQPSTTPKAKADSVAQRIARLSKMAPNQASARLIRTRQRRLRRTTPLDNALSADFSEAEVDAALGMLRKGTAAGFDGMYPEFLLNCGRRVRIWLAAFFTDLLRRNRLPPQFKTSKIIALLKPGKPSDQPESYRPIALLSVSFKLLERVICNRIYPVIEELIPKEQAGFMKGRSCADQVLSLTNNIEQGFQRRLKTGVVFVDLTAAYDTVWKRGLMHKLLKVIGCRRLCDFLMSMLSDREFQVLLNDEASKIRKLDNGLPQGSVLSCLLFNLYIHDLPPSRSRKFLYADDMAYAFQSADFQEISETLTEDLVSFSQFCREWKLIPSLSKTVVSSFHLNNNQASHQISVYLDGERLRYEPEPTYLGVTLDRALTYRAHLSRLSSKVGSRNNLIQKLAQTSWGADAHCVRISALALVYPTAEYCCSAWLNSAHIHKVDTQLNRTLRMVTGTVASTPLPWLPVLAKVLPADVRRKRELVREYCKLRDDASLPANADLLDPPRARLTSRRPPLVLAEHLIQSGFDADAEGRARWDESGLMSAIFDPDADREAEFHLPRRCWCSLNRLRTGHGRCNFMRESPDCPCGAENQTMDHILLECSNLKYNGDLEEVAHLHPDAISWLKNLDI